MADITVGVRVPPPIPVSGWRNGKRAKGIICGQTLEVMPNALCEISFKEGSLLLISVIFPIADLRRLIPNDTKPLIKPTWPKPSLGQFTRNFGSIKTRRGFKEWIPEEYSCDANKAIRFPNNFELKVRCKKINSNVKVCFDVMSRRLYFDGTAMAKLELCFKLKKEHEKYEHSISLDLIHRELAKLRVSLTDVSRGCEKRINCELCQITKYINQLFYYSTSYLDGVKEAPPYWVYSCKPSVIVSTSAITSPKKKRKYIQRRSKIIRGDEEKSIWFTYKSNSTYWDCSLWSISGSKSTTALKRKFRITLGRLHSESSVLSKVLQHVANKDVEIKKRSLQSKTLQNYLIRSVKDILGLTLFDRKIYGFKKGNLPAYCQLFPEAHIVHSEINKDDQLMVVEMLKKSIAVRPNLLKKVEQALTIPDIININHQGSPIIADAYEININGDVEQVAEKIINQEG